LIDEILAISREDNVKARLLLPDGTYQRVRPEKGDPLRRSQRRFMELARQSAAAPTALRQDAEEPGVKPRESVEKTEACGAHLALLAKPSLPS
jgi:ABC-type lipopolysaccharide export system ATPase subunit